MALIICVTTFMTSMQASSASALYRNAHEDRTESLHFYAPLDVSPEGIRDFLQSVYNRQEYIEILPNNLSHFIQFLQHGKKTHQTRGFAKSVIKLFSNKLKAVQYINAYAFSLTLAELPNLLEEHFSHKRTTALDTYKETINSILYSTFLSKYDFFKKNPKDFFDSLSLEILNTIENDLPIIHEDISCDELRQTLVRFLEISLGKLIWNPSEHEKIWDNFKTISRQFEQLMEHNIINDANDIDDLYWSLIHRFCFFLEVAAPELPVEFYEAIKNDLATQQLLLLELEEQEELIETKGNYLMQAILQGQAKKQAADMGIILR